MFYNNPLSLALDCYSLTMWDVNLFMCSPFLGAGTVIL